MVAAATPLQTVPTWVTTTVAGVIGLSLVAAGLAAAVALVYRWYVRERVPGGLPILAGMGAVALYLNSSRALSQVIGPISGGGNPLDETTAILNITTFLLAGLAARAGTDVGDRVGTDLFVATGAKQFEGDVSRVVQAVGRVITVEMPDEFDDIVGYDPVPDETKAALAGKTFVFPRRLTVNELRDRLVTRLKGDYAVGHVDVELGEDGTVEYIALGSRASGIGPTLPPETSAVAIRADPAFATSTGDLVQVWETDPAERVLTAEVRGIASDVVTLAVDAADTRKIDDTTEYKLVTLPVETRPDREFASLLRAADETMAAVPVGERSGLAGQPIGALAVTVVAIRPDDGPVEPLPSRERQIAAADTLYLIATPEAIRRVETAARPPADEPAAEAGSKIPPEQRVDAATPVAEGGVERDGSERDRPERDRSPTRSEAEQRSEPDDPDRRTGRADDTGRDRPGELRTGAGGPVDGDRRDEPSAPEREHTDERAESPDTGETVDADTEEAVDTDTDESPDERGESEADDPFEDAPGIDALDHGDGAPDDDPVDDLDLGEPDLSDLDGPGAESAESKRGPAGSAGDADGTAEEMDRAGGDESDTGGDESERGADGDPTRSDLADLPGADPEEFVGADADEGTADDADLLGDSSSAADDPNPLAEGDPDPLAEDDDASDHDETADNADGPDADNADGPDADNADGPDADNADGPDADNADGPDADNADGPDADNADDLDADNADGPDADNADDLDADNADGPDPLGDSRSREE